MKGIDECLQAFERLKLNQALNKKFVGIEKCKITPSIVSQEAGFDPGYLKKSRHEHVALIMLINDYKVTIGSLTSNKSDSKVYKNKIEQLRKENESLKKRICDIERINLYLTDILVRQNPAALYDIIISCENDSEYFK